jgi:hypothetical protein
LLIKPKTPTLVVFQSTIKKSTMNLEGHDYAQVCFDQHRLAAVTSQLFACGAELAG